MWVIIVFGVVNRTAGHRHEERENMGDQELASASWSAWQSPMKSDVAAAKEQHLYPLAEGMTSNTIEGIKRG